MVGFFYMIYDFPCIINKPSFYVIDVHAVLIVKDITGTIQYNIPCRCFMPKLTKI